MAGILLLGASGLVGGEALRIALKRGEIDSVVAPTRHPLPAAPKLVNPVSSTLEAFVPEIAGWACGSVVCALGTTRKKAGSAEALRHVDYELPLLFARAAHGAGAVTCSVVTSIGASVSSPIFYARTKGELERDLRNVGFQTLTILRPMLLGGAGESDASGKRPSWPWLRPFGRFCPGAFALARRQRSRGSSSMQPSSHVPASGWSRRGSWHPQTHGKTNAASECATTRKESGLWASCRARSR